MEGPVPINKYKPRTKSEIDTELEKFDREANGCYIWAVRILFVPIVVLLLMGAAYSFSTSAALSGLCYAFLTLLLIIVEALSESAM